MSMSCAKGIVDPFEAFASSGLLLHQSSVE
jgi:hypothetical protein